MYIDKECGEHVTTNYKFPKHVTPLYCRVVSMCTDAEYSQIVNIGPVETKYLRHKDEQLKQLLEDDVVRWIKDNLYIVSPYYVGKGEWEDILKLRKIYDKYPKGINKRG